MEMTDTEDGEVMGGDAGAEPSASVLHRTIKGFLPLGLGPAVDAISRHSRDIHNTTIHLSKTGLGCFDYDSKAKAWGWLPEEKRPRGWEPVIAAFAAGTKAINAERIAKHAKKMAEHLAALDANPQSKSKTPKLNLVPELGSPGIPPSFTILDLTLSAKVVREWIDPLDRPSPRALPVARIFPDGHQMAAWRLVNVVKAKRKPKAGKCSLPCPSLLFQRESVVFFSPGKIYAQRPAFARVPSNMARMAWRGARDSIATAIASQIAWLRTPLAARVGRFPSLPGYRPKGKLPTFSVSVDGGARLPSLKASRDIRLGDDRQRGLGPEALRKFNTFELREHVAKMIASRYASEIAAGKPLPVPKMIRIIPSRHGQPRIQLIVEIPDVHPEGSFLHELAKRHPAEWAARSKDKVMMNAWLLEIMEGQTWDPRTISPEAPFAWASQKFAAAGIDPGTTNIASMAFSAKQKMLVFGGRKVEAEDAKRARRIDKAVSELTLDSQIPELDAQIKAASASGLPKQMSAVWKLRRESQAIHNGPRVQKLRSLRQAGKHDAVERISSKIANEAFAAGVGIVVFSRSHGLKSASGKGRAFDKRSYSFPHAELAKRTREKLWELGIGMAEQEESGTSRASSADNDVIPTHWRGGLQMAEGRRRAKEREGKAKAKASGSSQAPSDTPQTQTPNAQKQSATPGEVRRPASVLDAFSRNLPKCDGNQQENGTTHNQSKQSKTPIFSGVRGAGGERSTFFRTRALTAREQASSSKQKVRQTLHADGQAALNAIRKASPVFKIAGRVRLGYQVLLLAGGCWMEWASPGLSIHPRDKGVAAAGAASS